MKEAILPLLAVVGLMLGTLLLPPRYDPAVRLKEWMIRKGWDTW